MTTGEAIAAVFEAYAAERGKPRWGDKTPLYMQHLPLLERLFPTARFVHLIRDGRDAALSFLSVPEGIMTEGWGHPRDAAGFACQWATEVRAARALGARVGPERFLEVRYEALVAEPEAELRRICSFAGLEYDEAMLGYVGQTDSARKEHQQRLNEPPRVGVRNWRSEMSPDGVAAFEAVAGDLLRWTSSATRSRARPRGRVGGSRVYGAQDGRVAGRRRRVTQRSPLWRRGTRRCSRRFLTFGPWPADRHELGRPHPIRCLARYAAVRAAEGDEHPVEREVVRPLRRDPGGVLPDRVVPHDLAVGGPRRVRLRLERREEDEVADDDRRAEDASADVRSARGAGRRSCGTRAGRR